MRTLTAYHFGLLDRPSRKPKYTRFRFTKRFTGMKTYKRPTNNEQD